MNILKQKRESMGLTLQQMADRLGIYVSNLHNYESGIRIFKTKDLLRVQQIYQLTDNELLEYIKYANGVGK